MKVTNLIAASALSLAALYAPQAAAQTWTGTKVAPTVYSLNTENSAFFSAPGTVGTTAVITGGTWTAAPYPSANNATHEYQICYMRPTATTYTCGLPTNQPSGTIGFTNEPARGAFKIVVKLIQSDPPYPVFPVNPGPNQNFSVTVNFK